MGYNDKGEINVGDLTGYVPGAGSNVFDNDFNWVAPGSIGSLAANIIDSFNGPWGRVIDVVGGSLPTYDINGEDAYKMIQLSLVTELTSNGKLYECYLTGDGDVKFNFIGAGVGQIDGVYNHLQGASYRPPCDNVVVTGYDPPPERLIVESKSISLFELADDLKGDEKSYFLARDEQIFKGSSGGKCEGIFRYGFIEYPTIDWDDTDAMAEAFDLEMYDTVVAYNYRVKIPFFGEGLTKLDHLKTSLRYYTLTNYGTYFPIIDIKSEDSQTYIECMGPSEIPETYRVNISNSTKGMGPFSGACDTTSDKFLEITNVYIQGFFLKGIFPTFTKSENMLEKIQVKVDSIKPSLFTLGKNHHYIVTIDQGESYITFFGGVPKAYATYFLDGTDKQPFYIEPGCIYEQDKDGKLDLSTPDDSGSATGVLSDGEKVDSTTPYDLPIFPIGNGSQGYAIKDIIVEVSWDSSTIVVEHSRGSAGDSSDTQLTQRALESVEVILYPIVIRDKPAPMWIKGREYSMALHEEKFDTNIATVQDISFSDYVQALSALENGDIQLTLPFLNEDGVESAAETIFELVNEESPDSTYIFGPNTDVELGQSYGGGFINEINYNYQDQSQYTVSVRVGPKWRDLGQGWANSVLTMKTTDKSGIKGVVREAGFNGAEHLVEVDKLGSIPCLNVSPTTMVNVGDIVDVTVKNIPVGLL